MLVIQILLLVLLAAVAVSELAVMARVMRGAAKRRLLDETRYTLCDAPGSLGISVLCDGVRSLEQVAALLDVGYDRYEVVLLLDAGHDAEIFAAVAAHYHLIRVGYTRSGELPSDGVRGLYRSRKRCFRRLVVLDKARLSVSGGLDAAAGAATYDYVLPMREGWRLMPYAIGRLAAELGEYPAGGVDLVRAAAGIPALLISREAVVAAGGFAHRPWQSIPRRRRSTIYEPLIGPADPPGRRTRLRNLPWALLLGAAVAASAAAGWWTVCAVLLTGAVVWGTVSLTALFAARGTECVFAPSGLLRRINLHKGNFTLS